MKVLVLGGAGFIGSNFARLLAKHDEMEVKIYDALTYAGDFTRVEDLVATGLEFLKADILDTDVLHNEIRQVDLIVNFAAETHNDRSLLSPNKFIETNIVGLTNILEGLRKHNKKLIHISTDEVFGDLDLDDPKGFNENSPYRPSSPYSASKASGDMLVRAWTRSFGVKSNIVNCSNNYGPQQSVEKFIPRQITNLLSGQKPKLYGDGRNVRDWIHVNDHCEAILRIIQSGVENETFLVGVNNPWSNFDLLQLILEIMGYPADYFEFVRDRSGHDVKYLIDASKLNREIEWTPSYSDFRAGLEETILWYQNNVSWWRRQKSEIEEIYRKIEGG